LEEALFHQGLVVDEMGEIVFNPDGKLLAQYGKRIALYEESTGKALELLHPFGDLWDSEIRSLEFSRDGSRMAALGPGGEYVVWETETFQELYRGPITPWINWDMEYSGSIPFAPTLLTLSPDGTRLAASNGPELDVMNLATGETWSSINPQPYDFYIEHVAFSIDGKRVYIVLNKDRAIQVWDAHSGSLLDEIWLPETNGPQPCYLSWPFFVRIDHQEDTHSLELWNLETHTYQVLMTSSEAFTYTDISADGKLLYAMNKKKMYAWRTSDGLLIGHSMDFPDTVNLTTNWDGSLLIYYDAGDYYRMDASEFTDRLDQVYNNPPPVITPTDLPDGSEYQTISVTSLGQAVPSGELSFIPKRPISRDTANQVAASGHFGIGEINNLTWEADNARVVIAGSRSLATFDAENGVALLTERNATFTGTATLSNGHLIATGILGESVFVYDQTLDQVLLSFKGLGYPNLSPDGHYLVYETPNGNLMTYDLENNRDMAIIYDSNIDYVDPHPLFSPDGNLVASIQDTDNVHIWDARTGGIYNAVGAPDGKINDLSFSLDGNYLVGVAGGSAWVWEVSPSGKSRRIEIFPGTVEYDQVLYQDTVTAAGLSPDNKLLAVGTSRHDIRIYNRVTGELLRVLKGHAVPVTHLTFDPGNQRLLSADSDGNLILWNTSNGAAIKRVSAFASSITGLVTRGDGSLSAWSESTCWVINPMNLSSVDSSSPVFGKILTASPDGKYLAVYKPYRVYLVDSHNGEILAPLEGEVQDVDIPYPYDYLVVRQFYGATFSHDSHWLVTYGESGVWLYAIGEKPQLLKYFKGYITNKALFSTDDRYLIFNPYEYESGNLRYDLTQYYTVMNFEKAYEMNKIAYSNDGSWLAGTVLSWNSRNEIIIWNAGDGNLDKNISLNAGSNLTVLAYNPDDTLIAVGQEDGTILLLNASTGEILRELKGHTGSITTLAFTADGLYLVSGSTDGTVGFWAVKNP
jgi:WD40 repeat protein